MRTTINLDDDVLLIAKQVAGREGIPLGEAVSRLVRRGVQQQSVADAGAEPLRGRFALLPQRAEAITPAHIRDLMEREGI